jgi:hypothetical protein
MLQSALAFALTLALLLRGDGLLALAIGPTVPTLFILILAALRTFSLAPDLMTGWSLPSRTELSRLMGNGLGVWFGALGWHVISASNAVVITFIGRPELVPIYSCTAKLATMSTQLSWVLPDSGLVGLAQLFGERHAQDRLRGVVVMMLRLHALIAGGAACVILAFNPAFVRAWVGPDLFGGVGLSALLAASILVSSIVHGLIATASVLGNRFRVGVVVLVNGMVQTVLALAMGRAWGLDGIAAAGLLASAATGLPLALKLLWPPTGLDGALLARELLLPWVRRAAACVLAAGGVSILHRWLGVVPTAGLTALIAVCYVWQMRPLYVGLPLGARLGGWLMRLRLVPSPSNASLG